MLATMHVSLRVKYVYSQANFALRLFLVSTRRKSADKEKQHCMNRAAVLLFRVL